MLTEEEYYHRFKAYEKDKLFEIISNRSNYQEKALKAALRVIKDKGLEKGLTELLASLEAEQERTETEEINNIEQNSQYYSKAVQFKNDNNFINIRTNEIIPFEAALERNDIDFFLEEKHVDAFMALYPTHRYYFLNKDLEKIDEIMRELEMTDPQQDYKPFIKFEMKTSVIAITILLVVVLIIALISQ